MAAQPNPNLVELIRRCQVEQLRVDNHGNLVRFSRRPAQAAAVRAYWAHDVNAHIDANPRHVTVTAFGTPNINLQYGLYSPGVIPANDVEIRQQRLNAPTMEDGVWRYDTRLDGVVRTICDWVSAFANRASGMGTMIGHPDMQTPNDHEQLTDIIQALHLRIDDLQNRHTNQIKSNQTNPNSKGRKLPFLSI